MYMHLYIYVHNMYEYLYISHVWPMYACICIDIDRCHDLHVHALVLCLYLDLHTCVAAYMCMRYVYMCTTSLYISKCVTYCPYMYRSV